MLLYESYWLQWCNIRCVYIFRDYGNLICKGFFPYIKIGNIHVSHHTAATKHTQIKYCLATCRVLFSISNAILVKSILWTLYPAIEEVLEYLESPKRHVKACSWVTGTFGRWLHGNSEIDHQVSVRKGWSAMLNYFAYVHSYNIAWRWIIWHFTCFLLSFQLAVR